MCRTYSTRCRQALKIKSTRSFGADDTEFNQQLQEVIRADDTIRDNVGQAALVGTEYTRSIVYRSVHLIVERRRIGAATCGGMVQDCEAHGGLLSGLVFSTNRIIASLQLGQVDIRQEGNRP